MEIPDDDGISISNKLVKAEIKVTFSPVDNHHPYNLQQHFTLLPVNNI